MAAPGAGFQRSGGEAAEEPATADVVVINTCSVRERAEEKLYTRLGEIRQAGEETGRTPVVAVAGCVAQQEAGALLKRSSTIDVIVGTQSPTYPRGLTGGRVVEYVAIYAALAVALASGGVDRSALLDAAAWAGAVAEVLGMDLDPARAARLREVARLGGATKGG